MKNNNNSHNPQDPNDDQHVLNQYGLKSVIPDDEEYYTLDLTRGNPDEDDINEVDIASDDPLNSDDPHDPPHGSSVYDGDIVTQTDDLHPSTSNAGGTVSEEDAVTQNSDNGVAPGEAGHPGVDEGTE